MSNRRKRPIEADHDESCAQAPTATAHGEVPGGSGNRRRAPSCRTITSGATRGLARRVSAEVSRSPNSPPRINRSVNVLGIGALVVIAPSRSCSPASGEPASRRADETADAEQTDTPQWLALRLGGDSAGGMPNGRLRRLLSD